MTKFEDIKREVSEFQTKARTYFYDYNEKMNRARARYSNEVFKEESLKIWAEIGGHLDVERTISMNYISSVFEDIKKEFKTWMCRPINADLLATLNCVRNFEMKLSVQEIDTLAEAAGGSYFGTRIVSEVAKENGYFLKVPDMVRYTEALRSAENWALDAVKWYAGDSETKYNGRDLLPEFENNGVAINGGKAPVWVYVAAGDYLTKDKTLSEAKKMLAAASVPAALSLTPEEEKRIVGIIENIGSEVAKSARKNTLEEIEPGIMSKIPLLSEERQKAVEQFLDEGKLGYIAPDEETAAE